MVKMFNCFNIPLKNPGKPEFPPQIFPLFAFHLSTLKSNKCTFNIHNLI